mgnify:CR=1 FL=1
MKRYLLSFVIVFALCSFCHASSFTSKGSQQVEFSYDIGVYPQTIYQEDIEFPLNKNGSGIICFFKFDTYIRQLPYEDYSDYNKSEKYEAIYSPSENLLIFRRTICNLSNENWTPGIRSKFAKWFLLK